MAIDGIWTSELYGPFGWESGGIFVIERGRVIGGDSRHYSLGTCVLSGTDVRAELLVYYYGQVSDAAREEFTTEIVGTLADGVIDGTVQRPDTPRFELQIRLTKRMDLPGA